MIVEVMMVMMMDDAYVVPVVVTSHTRTHTHIHSIVIDSLKKSPK